MPQTTTASTTAGSLPSWRVRHTSIPPHVRDNQAPCLWEPGRQRGDLMLLMTHPDRDTTPTRQSLCSLCFWPVVRLKNVPESGEVELFKFDMTKRDENAVAQSLTNYFQYVQWANKMWFISSSSPPSLSLSLPSRPPPPPVCSILA